MPCRLDDVKNDAEQKFEIEVVLGTHAY